MPVSKMSICCWLTPTTGRISTSMSFSFLPDDGKDDSIATVNKEVSGAIEFEKRKKDKYHHTDATIWVKIAKYACENGNKSTIENLRELELADDHLTLTILDVFAAHRCCDVLAKLQSNYIHWVYVPASYTGELQPLAVGVNGDLSNCKNIRLITVKRN